VNLFLVLALHHASEVYGWLDEDHIKGVYEAEYPQPPVTPDEWVDRLAADHGIYTHIKGYKTPMTAKLMRGFACLSPERRKEIASMGGKSVSPEKRAYSQDRSLAVAAGLKGSASANARRKAAKQVQEGL
jgi:uncharacterized protein